MRGPVECVAFDEAGGDGRGSGEPMAGLVEIKEGRRGEMEWHCGLNK